MEQEGHSAFEWQAVFETGIGAIDDQHKHLVALLNHSSQILTDDSSPSDFEEVVGRLLEYAEEHFRCEEELMETSGYTAAYPDKAQEHRLAHQWFAEKVGGIQAQFGSGKTLTKTELVSFLVYWLVEHILHIDHHLGDYLRTR